MKFNYRKNLMELISLRDFQKANLIDLMYLNVCPNENIILNARFYHLEFLKCLKFN